MTTTPTTCRDCAARIDPTDATVPTLCPPCYEPHKERVLKQLFGMVDSGTPFDDLLDELRWQLLELGMEHENAEHLVDRLRIAHVLGLEWTAVAQA